MGVARAANNFGLLEEAAIGLNSNNMTMLIDNFRFHMALVMMAVSFVTLLILGLYLENVLPSQYGVRKPFYFFLTKAYWMGDEVGSARIENG